MMNYQSSETHFPKTYSYSSSTPWNTLAQYGKPRLLFSHSNYVCQYILTAQINSISFFEHHQSASATSSTSDSSLSQRAALRQCVIELDLLNRAPMAVQVTHLSSTTTQMPVPGFF